MKAVPIFFIFVAAVAVAVVVVVFCLVYAESDKE